MALYRGITLPGKPDLENIRRLDLLPMPAINEMQRVGMAIDRDYLAELSLRLGRSMELLRAEICSYIPPDKLDSFIDSSGYSDDEAENPLNVDSRDQLGRLMFDVLGIGGGRELKRTKSGARISTGKKQLEKLKREHDLVPLVLSYAEQAKLKGTYTDPLPRLSVKHNAGRNCLVCGYSHISESWRVHTTLLTTRTDTGRLSSKNPNLQNISARSELGREVRAGFVASEGMRLVGADYSQIEMRLGAHYSQDRNLLRIFTNDLDPHIETAKLVFDTDEPDPITQRAPCKNVNFGVFYGLQAPGLLDLMALTYATAGRDLPEYIDLEWCADFIGKWFDAYSGVKDYLDEQAYRARRYGVVWTLFGRTRRIPEVRSSLERVQAQGIRQAGNAPIQGTSADLMKLAITEVQDRVVESMRSGGVKCYPVITVHDELILEVEAEYADMAQVQMETIMAECMRDVDSGEWLCRVPLKADGKVMERWVKGG